MRIGEGLIEIEGALEVRAGLFKSHQRLHCSYAYRPHLRIAVGKPCAGWRKPGIDGEGFLKVGHAEADTFGSHLVPEVAAPEIGVVGRGRASIAASTHGGTGQELKRERAADALRDFFLDGEEVGGLEVVGFRPENALVVQVVQLSAHANLVSGAADIAAEQVVEAQLALELIDLGRGLVASGEPGP